MMVHQDAVRMAIDTMMVHVEVEADLPELMTAVQDPGPHNQGMDRRVLGTGLLTATVPDMVLPEMAHLTMDHLEYMVHHQYIIPHLPSTVIMEHLLLLHPLRDLLGSTVPLAPLRNINHCCIWPLDTTYPRRDTLLPPLGGQGSTQPTLSTLAPVCPPLSTCPTPSYPARQRSPSHPLSR